MKKFLTLLWLTITAFTFKATAQPGTTCNAQFSIQYLTNYTVKFNPVTANDSPYVYHYWSFGDASAISQQISPTHTYALPGTYSAVHTIVRTTPNNVPVCTQSFTKTVIIAAPCNLVANFSWTPTATNPLRIEFTNLSTPLSNTDSIRWTFGDGSSSAAVNPVHIYNVPGTYTVCLRVKKIGNVGSTVPCVREICKTVVVTAPCNLVVDFSWTATPANPLRIEFHNLTNTIAATDSIRWTFGDGTTSSAIHPVHIYNAPGTYTVCLRVIRYNAASNIPCIREICKTVVVTQPCNLVVNFSSQPDPDHPLRIKFTNQSVPVIATDSVKWTFGDGTSVNGVQGNPNVANPTHNYTSPGTYTVCLTVKKHPTTINTPCIRTFCRTIVVMAPCNLVVNFSAQPDPNHALRIKFTNLSTPLSPADSIRWTFGDGSSVSGLQSNPNVANPTHIYANAGQYRVCLKVKKNNNSTPASLCVREKCDSIIVYRPCNFDVNFRWHLDSINARKVYFTNLSTPPTATAIAVWTFGDGSSSTSWNAIHEYAQPGRYIVCLKIYLAPNSNCVREKCDTLFIPNPPPPCTQLSKYRFEKFPNDNQKYKFTPDYINAALQYTWTFGDGTGSHDPVAIHRYREPGVYIACLTVWRGSECASTTCKEIRVQAQVNCDSAHAWFTYQRNTQIPNKIQFTANATLPIIDQTWTITKLPGGRSITLHQNNPPYTFQDTGYYRVCLKAVLLGGCVKEYCSYIRIEHVSNACELQAFPNPTSALVNVNLYLPQPETIHAYVYNSINVLVLDKRQQGFTGNNLVTLKVNNLVAGHYTIKLVYGNKVCYARFQKL